SAAEDGRGVEHGSVNAYPLHRGTVGRLDEDGAAGAAADTAGHVLLERHLASHAMAARERGDGDEHAVRAAAEDLRLAPFIRAESSKPGVGEFRDVAAMAAVKP